MAYNQVSMPMSVGGDVAQMVDLDVANGECNVAIPSGSAQLSAKSYRARAYMISVTGPTIITLDGTNPTSSAGILLPVGGAYHIGNPNAANGAAKIGFYGLGGAGTGGVMPCFGE